VCQTSDQWLITARLHGYGGPRDGAPALEQVRKQEKDFSRDLRLAYEERVSQQRKRLYQQLLQKWDRGQQEELQRLQAAQSQAEAAAEAAQVCHVILLSCHTRHGQHCLCCVALLAFSQYLDKCIPFTPTARKGAPYRVIIVCEEENDAHAGELRLCAGQNFRLPDRSRTSPSLLMKTLPAGTRMPVQCRNERRRLPEPLGLRKRRPMHGAACRRGQPQSAMQKLLGRCLPCSPSENRLRTRTVEGAQTRRRLLQ
jgi:hypothetical protein